MTINIKTNEFRLNDSELKTISRKVQSKINNLLKYLISLGVVINLLYLFIALKTSLTAEIVEDLIFAFFMLSISMGTVILGLKKALKQLKNNRLLTQSSWIEINENYISQSYEDGSYAKLNINLFSAVDRKENLYLFMRDELISFILPDRALGSEIQLQEINNFLIEKQLLSPE